MLSCHWASAKRLVAMGTVLALLAVLTPTTLASDSSEASVVYFTWQYESTYTNQSPLSTYAQVNNGNNTPREDSPNPHNGTDLNAAVGTNLYSIYAGTVLTVDRVSTTGCGHTLEISVTGTNFKVRYCHLDTIKSTLSVGSTVAQGEYVGTTGNTGAPAHLHYTIRDRTCDCSDDMTRHYRFLSSTQWRSGDDLEFIKRFYVNQYIFEARVYAIDSYIGSNPITPSDIIIYHRRQGTSTWTQSTMTSIGNYWYRYDLSGYGDASFVEVMVRAIPNTVRTGRSYHDNYQYGWAPPYKYRPSGPADNASQAYLVFVTI